MTSAARRPGLPARSAEFEARRRRHPLWATAIISLLLSVSVHGASRYDPRLIFRTLTTPHFVIYFHQGEDALASRLARIAEEVERDLPARLLAPPRGRTHVILVDQSDLSNGWATPLPYNTIEVTAAPPGIRSAIGNTDDWLRLVFTHEYTHILHLERSRGLFSGVRRVLGRSLFAFPNLVLPQWQVEGIATFAESAATGRGRLRTGDFGKFVDVAARRGRAEPIDRANGGLIAWPSGETAYAYGGYFHEYLTRRFGERKLAELADRTAGRFFYTASRAFRDVFGESLGDLWKAFEVDAAQARASGPPSSAIQLTDQGFVIAGPRFLRQTGPESALSVGYSSRTPHEFPAMYRVDPKDPRPVRVARRFVGDHLTSTADAIYFDQLEVANDVGLVSDLYRFDRRTEQVARLTCGARFGDPDVSPDGQRFAAVKSERGARSLVILTATWPVPCGQPASLFELSSPDMTYESPRWSPDGTHIAVARQIIHGPSEIVLVDALTGRVAVVDRSPSRNVTPAWMPDGRTIVFASDRDGVFNLFARQIRKTALGEIEPGPLARITTLEGGATFPDVSSDGRSLVFVGYTTAGYDLFTMPVDPAQWTMIPDAATPVSGVVSPARGAGTASNAPRESEPDPDMLDGPGRSLARYTPWGTLLPRSWLPAAELVGDDINIGGTTFGGDVLGRHAYSVSFLFPVRQSAQRLALQAARPEWFVSYAYDRWKPTFYAAASDTTDIVLERRDPADIKEHVDARERRFEVGLILPRRRVRSSHTWLAAIQLATRREATLAEVTTEDRHAFRLAWSFDTARQYGYSISHEDGISTTLTFERVTRAIGASGDATAATADVRGYFGVGPRHSILALRGAGGLSTGDERVRRTFSVGGSESRPASLAFGRESLALLRGFSPGDLAGTRAAVVNVEQRFALARIERGRGTWPLFLRTAHGALFADIGHAWDGRFSTGDLKRAFGGELSIDLVAGYFLPLTATAGVAWTYDRARERPSGRGVYVRFGRAF